MYNDSIPKSKQAKTETIILILCISCIVLFLISSGTTADRTYDGLLFSVKKVIPSIFPVMFTADILLRSGALSIISDLLSPIMLRMKKNPAVIIPYLAGMVCGFPVGAKYTRKLAESGQISKHEADCILAGANCAGPAFVISSVGAGIYSSASLGVMIWIVCTFTSFCLSFYLLPEHKSGKTYPAGSYIKKQSFAEIFCSSAKSTSLSVLTIICFITFFYTLSQSILSILDAAALPTIFSAATAAVLEIGSGCITASQLSAPFSLCLSSFAVGFGGLCVFFQVKCEAHEGADMRKYLLIKTVSGLVSSLFSLLLLQ